MGKIIFFVLIIAQCGVACAQLAVTSPDRIYTTWVDSGNLMLRNNTTGKESVIASTLPVLSLQWTKDSKTIINVQQIAGGSMFTIFSWIRGWDEKDFEPPKNGDVCAVVGLKIGWDDIHVTYKARERMAGPESADWTCSFKIDTKTATTSDVVVKPISEDDYAALKDLDDSSPNASE